MWELVEKDLEDNFNNMVQIRRYLHQNPELSFQETKTAIYIREYYDELGLETRTNVGGGGILAYLNGGKPGKTVALRADFDGLPIQDEKDVSYKSQVSGVMHACGHDGHTATLLTLANVLAKYKEKIKGNIVFLHQHAEEQIPGGAKLMIEDGCLDGVDAIFGTHLWSTDPLGTVYCNSGSLMATGTRFELDLFGKGGHGGEPHNTKDSIVAGAQIVTQIQQIVSRRIDPAEAAVVSVGTFEAGTKPSIIADSARITGTVRALTTESRDFILKELERFVKSACLSYQMDYDLQLRFGHPPVINHEAEANLVRFSANQIPEVKEAMERKPRMASEDFSRYLQEIPGAFFFTGARDPNWELAYPHHHPKFDIDERAMLIASKVLGKTALNYLNEST